MRERERTSVKRVQGSFDWIERSRPRGESKASITDEKNGRKKERKKGNTRWWERTRTARLFVDPASSLPPWIEERKEKFLTGDERRKRKGEVEGTLPAAPILILD